MKKGPMIGMLIAGVVGLSTGRYMLARHRHAQELLALDQLLLKDREAARKRQDLSLHGELSPFTRLKEVKLKEGENRLATDALLSIEGLPPEAADTVVTVKHGQLSIKSSRPVLVNATETTERELLDGDLIGLGRLRLMITIHPPPDQVRLVVHDAESPRRTEFKGPQFFPYDSEYTAPAAYREYPPTMRESSSIKPGTLVPPPRQVQVQFLRGGVQMLEPKGVLDFKLQGQSLQLETYSLGGPWVILHFRDKASGPTGRFLSIEIPKDRPPRVDFNQAVYPLCAYVKGYVCPEVPKGSDLSFAVPVGEKAPPPPK